MAVVERDAGLAHLRRVTRWVGLAPSGWPGSSPWSCPGPSRGARQRPRPFDTFRRLFHVAPASPATTTPKLQALPQAPIPTTAPVPVPSGGS